MPIIEIKVPSPGESITEVSISRWLKSEGDHVEKNEEVAEIESDKATLTISAEESGGLKILVKEGETVNVGSVVGKIDTDATGSKKSEAGSQKTEVKKKEPETVNLKPETVISASPLAKNIMKENKIPPANVTGSGTGGKITKADVLQAMTKPIGGSRDIERKKMTPLRKKLAQRLVAVKNETAMLTTFNEVDMSQILQIRAKYNPEIEKKSGIKLGFMSFFTKAVCEALQLFPAVNAMFDNDEIVYHHYCDIGIAVSATKGLVVPVLRNAEKMTHVEIEKEIKRLAEKARDNKLSLDEMSGGTFTITNGGVFGSLMSTPILNPPQSGILGMHNIVERPIAVNKVVEIRPMMYIALSYDHRIIDGKESVGFLVKVKEMCENPAKLLFGEKDPETVLAGL